MSTSTTPFDNAPRLIHHTTLKSPSLDVRAWSSAPHPDPHTPLLATATSDKSVHVWDMRSWKLLSTINGGHKRSIRCVGWKDYGSYHKQKKRKTALSNSNEAMDEETVDTGKQDPVTLATGSFDSNTGLWAWNRNYGNSAASGLVERERRQVPGGFVDEDEEQEQDFTDAQGEEEENEEWHFATLLTGPDSEIKDVKFSPAHYGANLLATCSRDKSVWVWEEVEPEEWETIAVLSEHVGDVKCLGWCQGARTTKGELQRRLNRRAGRSEVNPSDVPHEQADVIMTSLPNGVLQDQSAEDEDLVVGSREVLASGSYDDTIRLYHDDEAEGDWICIAALSGHDGTVWDLKFEPHISLSSYPIFTTAEEIVADWTPRLISCSDDLTVRIWRKELNDKEREQRVQRIEAARQQGPNHRNGDQGTDNSSSSRQTGFASSRLPSVIRIGSSTEKWVEEVTLPAVHVRSIYALDWSSKTGLVVTCGGDGVVAVYQEVTAAVAAEGGDVVMANGGDDDNNNDGAVDTATIKKARTEWKVVALVEAAHDVYEINHVCWAPRLDFTQRQLHSGQLVVDDSAAIGEEEEYIVTTGDDGDVRAWKLPDEVLRAAYL